MATEFEPPVVIGWGVGIASAILVWLAQRVLGKAAFQTAINDGFAKLTEKLQKEREELRAEIDIERKAIETERRAFNADRIQWSLERTTLLGRIRNLEQFIVSLEAQFGVKYTHSIPEEPGFLPVVLSPGDPNADHS